MKQSVARGIEAAGENGGGTGMAFMGMGMNAAGNMMNSFNQTPQAATPPPQAATPTPQVPNQNAVAGGVATNVQNPANNVAPTSQTPQAETVTAPSSQPNSVDKLLEMKKLLDAQAITQEDYDKVKAQILGL